MRSVDSPCNLKQSFANEREKRQGSSTNDPKFSYTDHQTKQVMTFLSTIFNPYFIEGSDQAQENVSKCIYTGNFIKRITKNCKNLFIEFQEKKQAAFLRKDATEYFKFSDSEIHKQFQKFYNSIVVSFPIYRQKFFSLKQDTCERKFNDLVSKLGNKSFMAWFMPIKEDFPMLNLVAVSSTLLEQIGSQYNQFPVDLEQFKEYALEFVNWTTYSTALFTFLESLPKYGDQNFSEDSREQIVLESEKYVINELKGNKQIILEMRVTIPEPFIILFQTVRVLEQKKKVSSLRQAMKKQTLQTVQQNIFKTLHNITKLPSAMYKQTNPNMCGYVLIPRSKRVSKKFS